MILDNTKWYLTTQHVIGQYEMTFVKTKSHWPTNQRRPRRRGAMQWGEIKYSINMNDGEKNIVQYTDNGVN